MPETLPDIDTRTRFKEHLDAMGITYASLARKVDCKRAHISNILALRSTLTESMRARFNQILKTNF